MYLFSTLLPVISCFRPNWPWRSGEIEFGAWFGISIGDGSRRSREPVMIEPLAFFVFSTLFWTRSG